MQPITDVSFEVWIYCNMSSDNNEKNMITSNINNSKPLFRFLFTTFQIAICYTSPTSLMLSLQLSLMKERSWPYMTLTLFTEARRHWTTQNDPAYCICQIEGFENGKNNCRWSYRLSSRCWSNLTCILLCWKSLLTCNYFTPAFPVSCEVSQDACCDTYSV